MKARNIFVRILAVVTAGVFGFATSHSAIFKGRKSWGTMDKGYYFSQLGGISHNNPTDYFTAALPGNPCHIGDTDVKQKTKTPKNG